MSHPKNKRERFLISMFHGKRRGKAYWAGVKNAYPERATYLRRNTTKLCSCSMCGNPRRVAWKDKLTMQEKRFLESYRLGWWNW